MTRTAATSSSNLHGRATPSYPDFEALYETRHGRFGGGRVLWDDGEPPAPTPAPTAGSPDPLRLTDAEWRAKRKGELADAAVDKLVQKVIDLEADAHKLRQRQTPEGSRVLTADEARAYDAYVALGKPETLKTELETGKAAVTERDTLKRSAEIAAVADVAKAKTSVLTERLNLGELTAKVQGEGDKKAVHVFDKDGKDLGELRAYADQHWADYVPSLFPQGGAAQTQGTVVTPQAGAGTAGASTGPTGYAAQVLAARQAAANPTPPPSGGTA